MDKIYYDFDENEEILNRMTELINNLDSVDTQLYNEIANLTEIWQSDASSAFYVSIMNTEDSYQQALQSFIEHIKVFYSAHSYYRYAKDQVNEGITRKLGGF